MKPSFPSPSRVRFLARGLGTAALGLVVASMSCTPVYTMHQTRVRPERTKTNAKALARIAQADTAATKRHGVRGATVEAVADALAKEGIRVGVLTDTHSDYEDFEKAVKILNARHDIDFIVLVGDFTNIGMIWEYDRAWEIMAKLRHPLVSLLGNHDAVGFGADIYADMFGADNFTFSFKGVRFVAWNNAKLERGLKAHDFPALERMLAMPTKDARTIVISHIPPTEPEKQIYTSGEKEAFHALLEKNRVVLSLHGHRHSHGWQKVGGVDYVTAERVRGVNYGILTLKEAGFRYEWCKASGCVVMGPRETMESWR